MVAKFDLKEFVEERNAAFINAVKKDEWEGVKSLAERYGIPLPKNEATMKAGVYKAVHECREIPEDVKAQAAEKCMALGFCPVLSFKKEE